MMIMDGLRDVRNGILNLPPYIRAPMSLKSGTKVYLFIVSHPHTQSGRNLCEMLVSPINFEQWGSLWKIRAVCTDRPGVVAKFLGAVAQEHFNVCIEESSSVENRSKHAIELLVNPRGHSKLVDEQMRIRALKNRILATCIDDLLFDEHKRPTLFITKMEGLLDASKKFNNAIGIGGQTNPDEDHSVVSDGKLQIPPQIFKRILKDCGFDPAAAQSKDLSLRVLLASDTKERTLRAYFAGRDEAMVFARIVHRDQVGALASISKALFRKDFDILQSLTRVQRVGDRNHLDVVLSSRLDEGASSEDVLKKKLEKTLCHSSLTDYELSIAYPDRMGSAVEGSPLRAAVADDADELEVDEPIGRKEVAEMKLQECQNRVERTGRSEAEPTDLNRIEVLRRVVADEGGSIPNPLVFISYDFSRSDLADQLDKRLKRAKCRTSNGLELVGRDVLRNEIIEKIKGSDGFLGLWTLDAKTKRFSPWLLWELAVAQSFSIPFQLVISVDFPREVYRSILPERYLQIYRDGDFTIKSKKAIAVLAEEVRKALAQRHSDHVPGNEV